MALPSRTDFPVKSGNLMNHWANLPLRAFLPASRLMAIALAAATMLAAGCMSSLMGTNSSLLRDEDKRDQSLKPVPNDPFPSAAEVGLAHSDDQKGSAK
jgi:hypothetical protein